MRAEYTNGEMERMIDALAPLLPRADIIGYAAARNTRALRSAATEYYEMRERLVRKHGRMRVDGDGNPTGVYEILPDTPELDAYRADIAEFQGISHEVELYRIPSTEVIGKLSGTETLAVYFMLEDGEGE
jgi:hypothetical protein